MSERAICIHGHFYQPPRENPWLEAIEKQGSAYPYHDWNARITAECYATNAVSRVLDDRGRIVDILDNYERISFNFGPTLLSWLEDQAPEVYEAILQADRRSIDRFGHGSALAQAYNHMILPLASERDIVTQVRWGIRDFEHRFGRRPRGMWLPETAVDLRSLEALAREGIEFTILAPRQAARVRAPDEKEWRDVDEGSIDTGGAYLQELPSGRSIAVFFYDGPLSRAIAFERLLESGERLADRLTRAARMGEASDRIAHVATDGETYGHHHRHGEMALSFALQLIEDDPSVRLVNYAEWLERHPPVDRVEIHENSSWSCIHGVERWRSDCGCSTGGRPGWNQAWRAPLRAALDWLRDELAPRYEKAAKELLRDPWEARDAYIDVILDRSDANVESFLEARAVADPGPGARVRALELLELQRHAMLMFTSCGWFFDDLSGIETVQVLQYGGRAVQLAQRLFGDSIEERFLERLERAESNLPAKGNGRDVYGSAVRPAIADLRKVAAHYAVTSLFEGAGEQSRVYCFDIERLEEQRHETGRARLAIGRARVRSSITREAGTFEYATLHLGDHNVVGGARPHQSEASYRELSARIAGHFERADFPDVIRDLDEDFHAPEYSLRSLFHDERERILRQILAESVARATAQYVQIHENRAPLMRFLTDLGLPLPRPFRMAAEFVLNSQLKEALEEEPPDLDRMRGILHAAADESVGLDALDLELSAESLLQRGFDRLIERPGAVDVMDDLVARVEFVRSLPFHVSIRAVQNRYWRILREQWPTHHSAAAEGDSESRVWADRFERLGEALDVAVERVAAQPAPVAS